MLISFFISARKLFTYARTANLLYCKYLNAIFVAKLNIGQVSPFCNDFGSRRYSALCVALCSVYKISACQKYKARISYNYNQVQCMYVCMCMYVNRCNFFLSVAAKIYTYLLNVFRILTERHEE